MIKLLYSELQRFLYDMKESWMYNENINREILYMQERIAELEARVSVLESNNFKNTLN